MLDSTAFSFQCFMLSITIALIRGMTIPVGDRNRYGRTESTRPELFALSMRSTSRTSSGMNSQMVKTGHPNGYDRGKSTQTKPKQRQITKRKPPVTNGIETRRSLYNSPRARTTSNLQAQTKRTVRRGWILRCGSLLVFALTFK